MTTRPWPTDVQLRRLIAGALTDAGGPLSIADLQRRLLLSYTHARRGVDLLVADGLVERAVPYQWLWRLRA